MPFTSIMLKFITLFFLPLSLYMLINSTYISLSLPIFSLPPFFIPINLLFDWMSCLFLATVSLISSLILTFSSSYIPNKEFTRFSLLLLLFMFSMMLVISSDNLIFILLGWDGLGFSSYILVIYYQNYSTAASGSITILSNRIGDIMIIMSLGLMLSFLDWNFSINNEFSLLILMLLIIAACSKSAQFPFSAWLPEAMAAPTPISALVHSSTLVTAGIYLLIRIMNNSHPLSMLIIMSISTITIIIAGFSANWEQDMKKIIALSTLSQIAMMLFAISMFSINIAYFHLISHALFKSTMFLCAGIIIHSSSYQDMRHMGSIMFNIPLMSTILGISNLTLMGIPFTSGFFSKDAIIENMLSSKFSSFLSILMIMSIGLTASYSIRMCLFSLKINLKSKPDLMLHSNNYMDIPILIMILTSILTGTSLYWLICPNQIFLMPFSLKISTIMNLFIGIMIGFSLSFYNKKYIKLGISSISLWFTHTISTKLNKPFLPVMNMFMNNDKSWQESYGPQELFSQSYTSSSIPIFLSLSLMFIFIIMLINPIIFLF